ncbi:TetR/AcrR family transcriptional regulator [Paenibacillus psychroresistens]|uniref:TetR/AcrR family transcriptional regulator n=1 Tax=Paenibacillus psychroresistens TaxID=1778678 RepID=A0A6B8RHS0_9BACL|nr:TetR/AcrR family transcriptional regulator [Paenibacillus psychroresistens]QGQ95083.1 TetR/AcrR family transcriptional regulator [Paenibacillus psychroresistens]
MDKKESTRLDYVLDTAISVFSKNGYRKTSIEDIAKAAGISRQGIYLHYKNKDDLFRASFLKAFNDGQLTTDQVIEDDTLSLEEKLFKLLDEWFGRHVGLLHPDIQTQCERILGNAVMINSSLFQMKIEQTILSASKEKTDNKEKQAKTIANILCACALTWKYALVLRQEFSDKMSAAIHLCCKDL